MRYIKVPNQVQLVNLATGEVLTENGAPSAPFSMHRWLVVFVLSDQALGAGYKAMKACHELDKIFHPCSPGQWAAVEEEHWELLKKVVEHPQGQLATPAVISQFLPFMEAVMSASPEKPMSELVSMAV